MVNYLVGRAPGKWRTHIPTFAEVKYLNLYPGVDLIYHGRQQQLEYDFVVAPGADPRAITLAFQGAERLEVDQNGDLLLHLPGGILRQLKPVIYQEVAGVRQEISGGYILKQGRHVSFRVGPYDQTQPLVIDPVIAFSTYLGGASSHDYGNAIAVDATGHIYLSGTTYSSNFPTTPGAYQTSHTTWGSDAFVVKLTPDGANIIYATYLGGCYHDATASMAVDAAGQVMVVGQTQSPDFPTTPGALQPQHAGHSQDLFTMDSYDAFVAKLTADGAGLVFSTYMGGYNRWDKANGVAVDAAGNAWVVGKTVSFNFPVLNSLQAFNLGYSAPTYSGTPSDAFVAKFAPNGTLLLSSFLGGKGFDEANAVTVDSSGHAYVTGVTQSINFPTTPGAFQGFHNGPYDQYGWSSIGADAFVTKLAPEGSSIIYSTFLGGFGAEMGTAIAVDAAGCAYVTGTTCPGNDTTANFFPFINAWQPTPGGGAAPGYDAFVAKLNAAGSALVYSTYLGGSGEDRGKGIAVDRFGNALVIGYTNSSNFPTLNPLQAYQGSFDAFFAKLNPTGAVSFSTYLGGSGDDGGQAVCADSAGNIYLTGYSASSNFPLVAPLQPSNRGYTDAFVMKIKAPSSLYPASGGNTGPVSVTIHGDGFQPGARVSLVRTGQESIGGEPVSVTPDGLTISTNFDLTDKPLESWLAVVTNPDGSSITISQEFIIEAGRGPELWTELLGRPIMRWAREERLNIAYGNRGNVDAWGVHLFLSIPAGVEFKLAENDVMASSTEETITQIYLTNIPAGSSQTIPLIVKVPAGVGETNIGVGIAASDMRFIPFSPPSEGYLSQTKNNYLQAGFNTLKALWDRLVGSAYADSGGDYADAIKTGWTDAATGYVGYFRFSNENGDFLFGEIGTMVDGNVQFMLPNYNYTSASYNDLKTGRFAGYRVNLIMWIRPAAAEQMPGLAAQIRNILNDPNCPLKTKKFCDPLSQPPNIPCPLGTLSCIGLAAKLIYPNGEPPELAKLDATTWDFFKYWAKVNKIWAIIPIGKANIGQLTLDFHYWWENIKKIYRTIVVGAIDPNAKFGLAGFEVNRMTSGSQELVYTICFENLASASAPAQKVVITDQLDPAKMDLNTFSLGRITFRGIEINPPPGLREFVQEVDLRPGNNLIVRLEARLDPATGVVIWRFTSLDAVTRQPLSEESLDGFLPPNVTPPQGEGSVLFSVKPQAGLPTGTLVKNKATIVFDQNPPIDTPEWSNTLDNTKPASRVELLALTQENAIFPVQWTGSDEGSGVKDYCIYVSEDGGPLRTWLTDTPNTAANFVGADGKSYAFFSVARDQTGNIEAPHPLPDASTRVHLNHPPVARAGLSREVVAGEDGRAFVTLDGTGSSDPDGDTLTYKWSGPFFEGGGSVTGATPTITLPVGAAGITLIVNDGKLDSAPDAITITVLPKNHAPAAKAGPSQEVVAGEDGKATVTLNGAGSSDPEGDPLTYKWSGPFAEGGGLVTGVNPTVTLPVGTHTITLVVNDGKVDSVPDAVMITVKPGNRTPLARAGASQIVESKEDLHAQVTLDGTGSFDPDGDLLTYRWSGSFPEGGGIVTGDRPAVTLSLGTTTITLIVNDGKVDSAPDTVSITVTVRPQGLLPPLASLVPEGSTPPLPKHAFRHGRCLPLRLRLFAGRNDLSDREVASPRLVSLEKTGPPPNLEIFDLDSVPAEDGDGIFRYRDLLWTYHLRTRGLAPGTYRLVIQMPDGRRFAAGFALR